MAKLREVQVCGCRVFDNLEEACSDYLHCLANDIDREKLNFAVELDDGTVKHITFRETEDGVEVYGDFEGMPDALEWAQKYVKEHHQ